MAEWADYRVEILDEPFVRPAMGDWPETVFEKTARVHFLDEREKEYETIDYAFVDPDDVLADVHAGKEINLRRCYVKDLALRYNIRDYRKNGPKQINLRSAGNAFFDGGLDLAYAALPEGDKSFSDSYFVSGCTNFGSVRFGNGYADFSGCRFIGEEVGFSGSSFGDGTVDFEFAQFRCDFINFSGTDFGDGEVVFDDANLESKRIIFDRSDFGEGLSTFWRTNFSNCQVFFTGSSFDGLSMYSMDINSKICFDEIDAEYIIFHCITIYDNLTFVGAKMKCIEFRDCLIHQYLDINWNENNLSSAIESIKEQDKLYENDELTCLSDSGKHHRAAETALLLKENFRKMGRYEDEDCAYYTYKKHDIRAEHCGKSFWKRMFDKPGFWFKLLVYELIGGYGTRPVRIFYTMLATVGIFALIYHIILAYGGTIKNLSCGGIFDWKALSCSLYFSAITFLTIGYGDLSPAHWLIRTLASIEGLIGLLLISYFTIAFSRKVLR